MSDRHDSACITRRGFLKTGIAVTASPIPVMLTASASAAAAASAAPANSSASLAPASPFASASAPAAYRAFFPQGREDYLHAAEEAARWIRSARIEKEHGIAWRPDPDHPQKTATVGPDNTIYSGSAGIVLFLLELGRATGDSSYLDEARRGADYLAATWPRLLEGKSPGPLPKSELSFDGGLAGTAFSLTETWKAVQRPGYRDAALAATQALAGSVRRSGVEWVASPGVGSGGGVLLYLLYAAHAFHDDSLRELAARGGERILELAERDSRGGLRWRGVDFRGVNARALGLPPDTYFPNFELGTAGVAYVLARLYEETRRTEFLDAAKEGARHIQSIATVEGDAALVHYREPDLTDIYYLGYCHGPAGTARLFYQLHKVTGDPQYLEWTEKLARGIVRSGVPENLTPGYWNVVCQCCGSAAVTELFLSLALSTGKTQYRDFALRVADQLISRESDLDGNGYRWYQAWTRVKPWEVNAETGYKIGAAGVGAALLHTHLAARGRYAAVLFPDNPFPAAERAAI